MRIARRSVDQLAEPTGKLFGGVVGGSVDSVLSVAIYLRAGGCGAGDRR